MNINNFHINPSERDKLNKNELIEARKNGFLLFGKTGSGKTTLLNAIYGKEVGIARRDALTVTKQC